MPNYLKLLGPVAKKLVEQARLASTVRQLDKRFAQPLTKGEFMDQLTAREYDELMQAEGTDLAQMIDNYAAKKFPGARFSPDPVGESAKFMVVDDAGDTSGWQQNMPPLTRVK